VPINEQERMTETDKDSGTDAGAASPRGPEPGRRRLLRGGIAAAPVLLTLVSRPVLGRECFPVSSWASMPASDGGRGYVCVGRTPGFWKQDQKFDQWPAPFRPVASGTGRQQLKATLFKDYFSPLPSSTTFDWTKATFLEVMKTEDLSESAGPPFSVARHAAAALLNIHAGFMPPEVLTAAMVRQGIWPSYMTTGGASIGYWKPTPYVKLYADGIIDFLTSGMI
jgi:hypothetical protein